ncbi:MAG: DsbE family thiol:disulfide interchange protein [Rhodobacteraceae bacterium]|nr:DsbE family thiol:disulfide interchange protein [Paracoccaceae bacterium]
MARISPLMMVPPVIFVVLAGLFAGGMFRDNPDRLPSAREGQGAPALALTPLGDYVSFDDATLRDGEVKLVNYWASWCAPCRAEHPMLERLAGEGVAIYGINYKDDPEDAMAFLGDLGNPYRAIGADESGRTAIDWGVYGVPETYVIDGQGRIVLRIAGPVDSKTLANSLRPALEKAAGGAGDGG